VPVASRPRAELEPLIGLFVNTLVLRTRLHRGARFSELVQQVKATTLDAHAHQDVPFEQLVEALKPQRNTAHSPLFQIMLVLQNAPAQVNQPAGLRFETRGRENTHAKFDLTLNITEEGEQLKTEFEYNTDLFDAGTIERLAGHFTRLLQGVVADPQQRIGQLALLDDAERHRMVVQWNDTASDYPHESTIHQLFEQQAARTPEATALVFEGSSLTYRELDAQANRLAHHLMALGARPDSLVAIGVPRGIDMVVALLATLKAGAAYVPLDPNYPADRLAYVLADSSPCVLITHTAICAAMGDMSASLAVLALDADRSWQSLPAINPDPAALGLTASNLAYVIYTSGSTGQPKGVMVEHAGVVNYLHWAGAAYAPTGSVVSSSLSFDATVTSLYLPLLTGGCVTLLPEQGEMEALQALLAGQAWSRSRRHTWTCWADNCRLRASHARPSCL
jgi:non-ribosomal peptide synthetase component F